MTKISREEYEALKSLGDNWKWITRDLGGDDGGDFFAYSEKPYKIYHMKDWGGRFIKWLSIDNYLFQFIQWEDSEPYNIQELIDEYLDDEYGYFNMKLSREFEEFIEIESEETEMKSKQELIEKWESAIESAEFYGRGREDGLIEYMRVFVGDLNQLDEPEVLSQEWIDDHAKAVAYDGIPDQTTVVYVDELQNLLVPKQKLPVMPNHVAEWISVHRERFDLYPALKRLENNALSWEDVYEWYRENTRKFVNAYLTGIYEVEEEQKYYLKIGNLYLAEPLGDMTSDIVRMTRDKGVAYQFTDEKSIATHLDKFEGTEAVKVEELEE